MPSVLQKYVLPCMDRMVKCPRSDSTIKTNTVKPVICYPPTEH